MNEITNDFNYIFNDGFNLNVKNDDSKVFSINDVISIVDSCFHSFASNYKTEAKELAHFIINKKLQNANTI